MKICFFGDAESIHIQRWCKHFDSLGHQVHLISFKNIKIQNTTVHYVNAGRIDVKGKNWKVLLKLRAIKRILKSVKPDIFHALYATSYGFTGALCDYHPYIITALGSDVLISPSKNIVYKSLLKIAFKKADWITVLAQHMKVVVKKLCDDESKISIVSFGIDPNIFNIQNRNLPQNEFVITSTRALEPIYNIPHLIKAVALCAKVIPNIKLNVVGAGSLEQEIKDLVNKKGLQNNTVFYGQILQPQAADILRKSHVFVSVSYSDGNNISLNEAMACGDLCIASDILANREWIEPGKNGFLIPVDDVEALSEKIIEAYKNYQTLSAQFTPINQELIEKRAIWANNMKQVEKKYLELVAGKLKQ